MGVTGSATYPVHNELRPRGVDARAPSALERVPSMRFDATEASVTALLASCRDAASERPEGRPKAACIAHATRARALSTNAPIATWRNCDPRGACSGCWKSASSSASSNAAMRTRVRTRVLPRMPSRLPARVFLRGAVFLPELSPEARARVWGLGRAERASCGAASAIRLHRTSDVATYFLPQARIARGAVPYRLFPSRTRRSPHISTRQYARNVGQWVSSYPFLADVRRESSSVARGSSGPSVLSPSRSVETPSSLAGSRHPSTS